MIAGPTIPPSQTTSSTRIAEPITSQSPTASSFMTAEPTTSQPQTTCSTITAEPTISQSQTTCSSMTVETTIIDCTVYGKTYLLRSISDMYDWVNEMCSPVRSTLPDLCQIVELRFERQFPLTICFQAHC